MTANTPSSRKAKGRRFQQQICGDLLTHLPIEPGDIMSTGMGQSGCDVYLSPAARRVFPYGVECKNVEKVALWESWRQCETNAGKVGLTPLLLIKRNREEPLAVLRWSDLLTLLRKKDQAMDEWRYWAKRWHDECGDLARTENLAEGLTGGGV